MYFPGGQSTQISDPLPANLASFSSVVGSSSGQATQLASIVVSASLSLSVNPRFVITGQSVHIVAPTHVLVSKALQLATLELENFPSAQGVQSAVPSSSVYELTGQGEQALSVTALNLPTGQGVHDVAPAREV